MRLCLGPKRERGRPRSRGRVLGEVRGALGSNSVRVELNPPRIYVYGFRYPVSPSLARIAQKMIDGKDGGIVSTKKKKKYRVRADVTISIWTEVEASSSKDAIRLAQDQPFATIVDDHRDGQKVEYWYTSGEIDGEPFGLTAEETE